MFTRALTAFALPVLVMSALAACQSQPVNRTAAAPLQSVAAVDLDRYSGRWYEVARLPNGFERDCEGVSADYRRRADGLIEVVNTCRVGASDGKLRIARGRARVVEPATNAKLQVSFFGPFWGDYWVIHLEEDYSLAIVGEPSGRYLWILAREATPDEAVLEAAVARLADFGYDASRLYFPDQPPVPDNPRPGGAD